MRWRGESISTQWRFAIVCRFHTMAYEIALESSPSVSCVLTPPFMITTTITLYNSGMKNIHIPYG